MQQNIELNKFSSKKNTEIKSILELLQEVIAFQDKIEETYELQESAQNKSQLRNYHDMIDKMYQELLDLAKGSVISVRKSSFGSCENSPHHVYTNDNLIFNV